LKRLANYSEEERKEREKLSELRQKYVQNPEASTVTVEHVEEVLARWTGMPVSAIRENVSSNPAAKTEPRSKAPPRQARKRKNEEPS